MIKKRRLTVPAVVISLVGLSMVTNVATTPGNAAELGGGRILFTYPVGQIVWTMCPDGTDIRDFVEGGAARWSPDGTKIAYYDSGGEDHIRTFTGDSDEIVADHSSGSAHAWSPDGTKLAFSKQVAGGYTLRVLDLETGSTTDLFPALGNRFGPPLLSIGLQTAARSPSSWVMES